MAAYNVSLRFNAKCQMFSRSCALFLSGANKWTLDPFLSLQAIRASTHSTDSEGFQNDPFLCYSLNSKQHPNDFLKRVALNHKSTKSCKEPSHWIISRTFLRFLQIPQKHHSFATAMNLRNHHFNRILRFPKKAKTCNKSGKKDSLDKKKCKKERKRQQRITKEYEGISKEKNREQKATGSRQTYAFQGCKTSSPFDFNRTNEDMNTIRWW